MCENAYVSAQAPMPNGARLASDVTRAVEDRRLAFVYTTHSH
jgi:hypothetical protein